MRDIGHESRFQAIRFLGLTHGDLHIFFGNLITINVDAHSIYIFDLLTFAHFHGFHNPATFQPNIFARIIKIYSKQGSKFTDILIRYFIETREHFFPIISVDVSDQFFNRVQFILQLVTPKEPFTKLQHVLINIIPPRVSLQSINRYTQERLLLPFASDIPQHEYRTIHFIQIIHQR